jgi:hypothetical protein
LARQAPSVEIVACNLSMQREAALIDPVVPLK